MNGGKRDKVEYQQFILMNVLRFEGEDIKLNTLENNHNKVKNNYVKTKNYSIVFTSIPSN